MCARNHKQSSEKHEELTLFGSSHRFFPRYLALSSLLFLLLTGCEAETSILTPMGPAANRIRLIWWILFFAAAGVFTFVMVLLAIALFTQPKPNETNDTDNNPDTGPFMGNVTFVIMNGVVMPAVVLAGVILVTITGMEALSIPEDDVPFTIEVIGHQFWWEVYYPDHNFVTANEIHIPVNEPIRILLRAEDVIHSFWIPEIQGKMDMLPDQVNETWIEASQPGQYAGVCAEFCGLQHANMRFVVVARTADDFEAWVAEQQRPAPAPQGDIVQEGWRVFQEEGDCAECHTIIGTNATGTLGPDLTHFASRLTIGAGAVPNNEGHLYGWILDAQSIKPGSLMPPIALTGEQVEALVAFMYTLD
jgi:cytochrome c oxidase subunit II